VERSLWGGNRYSSLVQAHLVLYLFRYSGQNTGHLPRNFVSPLILFQFYLVSYLFHYYALNSRQLARIFVLLLNFFQSFPQDYSLVTLSEYSIFPSQEPTLALTWVVFDPNDPDQQECLRKAECYVDRTVDPPVIRYILDDDDYEIVGWVWLTTYGELKANGVRVVKGDGYFIYNKRYAPGVYYLIRRHGREFLVSEEFLKSL